MTMFFTADLHLGHKNILKYDKRPFGDIKTHDQALIDNWNSVIGPGDSVYLLGDLIWSSDRARVREVLDGLQGKIHLIRGNHDSILDKPFARDRFTSVGDLLTLKLRREGYDKGKLYLTLCHFALRTWYRSYSLSSWQLHGHSHGQLADIGNLAIDVGVPVHDWTPISLEQVETIMRQRIGRGCGSSDHHSRGEEND